MFYIDELKHKTGNEKEVQDYVMSFPEAHTFIEKLADLVGFLIPNYVKEGKYQLVIGIGCTYFTAKTDNCRKLCKLTVPGARNHFFQFFLHILSDSQLCKRGEVSTGNRNRLHRRQAQKRDAGKPDLRAYEK